MGYTHKQYGTGFEILGKYEGWHYGIWKDSIPETFVFLKPVNEKCSFIETLSRTDGLYIRYDSEYGDMIEKVSDYGTIWKTAL